MGAVRVFVAFSACAYQVFDEMGQVEMSEKQNNVR